MPVNTRSESVTSTSAVQQARRARSVLLVLCGALFLDGLDVSMKSVALPSIGASLSMSPESLQWVVSGYTLGFGGMLLLGGRTADLLGRRRTFLTSLAAFAVASVVGGLAPTGAVLVAARFATGISAAFTAPAGLSIITTSFAEGPVRNRALSVYSATGASGFALGLVAGGLLTEASWRWVFFAPVLMALATLGGAIRLLAPDAEPAARLRDFDLPGAATVTAAMMLLVFTVVQSPQTGWASTRTLACLVTVAAALAAFALIERRSPAPLLNLDLLRSGPLMRANAGAFTLLGGWVGCLFIVTLYMQQVRGWSALATGLAVCPTGAIVAVLAPRVTAPLTRRFGTTALIAAGLIAATLAYAALLPLDAHSSYLLGMLPTFVLVGLAFTLAYGPLNIAASKGVPPHQQGVAGGLVNASYQIGPALAVGAITTVVTAHAGTHPSPSMLMPGLHNALLIPLAASVVGAAITITGRS